MRIAPSSRLHGDLGDPDGDRRACPVRSRWRRLPSPRNLRSRSSARSSSKARCSPRTRSSLAQDRDDASVAGKVTFQARWWDGDLTFRLTPFARLDLADDRRTHFDVREAKFDLVAGRRGRSRSVLDTVFWGKTEAVHLVDIINQTDGVEDLDDEDRLGQPMVRSRLPDGLSASSRLFYLPYFRERTFAGPERSAADLNPPVRIRANALYDTGAEEEWTPSFAARFAGTFGWTWISGSRPSTGSGATRRSSSTASSTWCPYYERDHPGRAWTCSTLRMRRSGRARASTAGGSGTLRFRRGGFRRG